MMDIDMKKGFTMVETIVAIGVFTIFFTVIFLILQQVLINIGTSRARAVALSIGQKKMELLRNLPYANVGTTGGIPSGPILQEETVTLNNQQFLVKTDIVYIDDPFDGVAPADPIPGDYKRARVQVTWEGLYPSRLPVTLVTNIAPRGIESNPGGGTLFIQVINAQGLPVSNANISVVNTSVHPNINYNTLTNSNGNVIIPAAPSCVTCYRITAGKAGYSTERTYATTEVANPLLPHATVIEGEVTQITFTIDQLGSMTIRSLGSQASGYPVVPNVIFTLRGSKIIGTDTSDNPVYKYSYQTTTGGGTVGIPNLEWDNYAVMLEDSNYTFAGSTPLNPVTLTPGQSLTLNMVVEMRYAASLLVILKDQIGTLIASGSANITKSGVDLTKYTPATGSPDYGQIFFNNLTIGLYNLIASAPGYQTASSSVNVTGNVQTTVVLH
jgi:hypothetical protein